MSVRAKAVVLLAAGVVGLVAAAWIVLSAIVEERFRRLEGGAVKRGVQRVLRAIDGELAASAASLKEIIHQLGY